MKKKQRIPQRHWQDNLTPPQEAFIAKFEEMGFMRNKKFSFKIPGGGMVKIISSHNNPQKDQIRVASPNYSSRDHKILERAVDQIKQMIQDSLDPDVNGSQKYFYSEYGTKLH